MKDDELRSKIRREAYSAPENPYFKRKVLNSLPPRRATGARWIVGCAYAVAFAILACYWAAALADGDAFGADRVRTLILWGFTLGVLASALYQPLRRLLS